MREIWKYKLDIGYLGVMIPKDAVILDIQWQVDSAVLWCIVNTNNQLEQGFSLQKHLLINTIILSPASNDF